MAGIPPKNNLANNAIVKLTKAERKNIRPVLKHVGSTVPELDTNQFKQWLSDVRKELLDLKTEIVQLRARVDKVVS